MHASIIRGGARALACALGLIAFSSLVTPSARAEEETEEPIERIVVEGKRPGEPDSFSVAPERATPFDPDVTQQLKLVPGGDVIDNGALSGQVQYRGMFGNRVHVMVDDMFISPGGPNWMDPPLHYAPGPILDHLEVDLGIASVSSGPESIGGTARAVLKSSEFGLDEDFDLSGELEADGRVADESFSSGGIVSAANENHRFHVLGSAEKGEDYRTGGGGRVRPSKFERYQYGGGYGFQLGDHRVGIDYRYNDTGNTGTPVLPMDIRFVDTHLGKVDYEGRVGAVDLRALVSYDHVDHRMDNFNLRQPPAAGPTRWRRNDTGSEGFGYRASGEFDLLKGRLELGSDGHFAEHDARITNPNAAAFFVEGFNDARKHRYGAWAEWNGDLGERWDLELGVRYTRVSTNADKVDALPAQTLPPPMRLRDAFNAADRQKTDDLVDAVLKVGFSPVSGLRFEVAGGRKTRAPSYLERYSWIPTQAAAGLADGNNYVGDVDLDPEVAYEVTGEIEWRSDFGLYLAPRAFYRRVDDYIQGTPAQNPDVIAVSTGNGDPTPLQFSNVDAELFGADLEYGALLGWGFQIDGVLSYVRGRRRDGGDDLYRIAPLRGRSALRYRADSWSLSVEGVYAADQNKVSQTNGESKSDSWAILNIYGSWDPTDWVGFVVGVNNVTDNDYSDHLAGTNRVNSAGADAGERLPAAGVNFFARAVARF
ncbi:MAG: TonB-dependent receptor plug domain-containing protein [Myxococcota bacterium]